MRRRYFLKERDVRVLLEQASRALQIDPSAPFGQNPKIEVVELSTGHIVYLVGTKAALVNSGNKLFPTLVDERLLNLLPSVVVDMGAVPHVCNGADVMAPGVVEIGRPFDSEALVVIRDERNRRPIAIGRALIESGQFQLRKSGRVVQTVHFVGDKIWEATKSF